MIETIDLCKSFATDSKKPLFARRPLSPGIRAVDHVSFVAADGEITGLLGPNGAGKTTTLRMLATMLSPDAGSATIDGRDIQTERAQVRQHLGVLSDAKGLYWRLTARENIVYFGQLHGMSREDAEQRADMLLDELGLQPIAHRATQGFSQGERMKVAIARALVHDPQTVLLDEPTNGLDIMATRHMRESIRGLKRKGKCVLFSSHIMQEVAALCDRVVIINRGRVAFSGTPAEALAATGLATLEDAFVRLIGTDEGLMA